MFAYLIAEPGLPLLFLYLHLLSLNKDDHFLITSTYSLLIYNTWLVLRGRVVYGYGPRCMHVHLCVFRVLFAVRASGASVERLRSKMTEELAPLPLRPLVRTWRLNLERTPSTQNPREPALHDRGAGGHAGLLVSC